jgi:hypothetical protein
MDKLQEFSTKIESYIEQISEPIKPMLPVLARFLLVVTFLEDTVRLMYPVFNKGLNGLIKRLIWSNEEAFITSLLTFSSSQTFQS